MRILENRKLVIGLDALLLFTLFMVWRFIRPMSISIVDLADTRLPPEEPRAFTFDVPSRSSRPAAELEAMVSYHLLDEARRKRIGYQNREPVHYPIYQESFALPEQQ